MKKMVFLDIDGTILNTENQIPESTKKGIKALKEKGIYVAIATGRGPFMFTDIRKELDIDTYVSFNGQHVVVGEEPVYSYSFPNDLLEKLLGKTKDLGHSVVYLSPEGMASSVVYDPFIEMSLSSLLFDHPVYSPDYYKNAPIPQLLLFCKEGEEKVYAKEFPDLEFIRWHELAVDVLPKGKSKAAGIQIIIDRLGLDLEDTYAFGDGLNDREMLKTVGKGIAMGNAHPELKKIAPLSTKHVNEDGLYFGFKQLGLL